MNWVKKQTLKAFIAAFTQRILEVYLPSTNSDDSRQLKDHLRIKAYKNIRIKKSKSRVERALAYALVPTPNFYSWSNLKMIWTFSMLQWFQKAWVWKLSTSRADKSPDKFSQYFWYWQYFWWYKDAWRSIFSVEWPNLHADLIFCLNFKVKRWTLEHQNKIVIHKISRNSC